MAERLENVSIDIKANVYFEGRITARMCHRADGTRCSLGVVTPGSYTFFAPTREEVQITAGEAEVLLPGESEWRKVPAPESYEVPAGSEYQVKTDGIAEYLCEHCQD